MKKSTLVIIASIVISGCSAKAVLVQKKVNYDPKEEARVRVYQSNGNGTTKVVSDLTCKDVQNDRKKAVSQNPFHRDNRHNGLPKRTLKSVSVGIPLTEQSAKALERSSYFETDSFIEQVIPANVPTIIRGSEYFIASCQIIGEFTPQAGKDYEIQYGSNSKYCRMFIHEIEPLSNQKDTKIQAHLGKEVRYKKCDLH
ncbi:hypothetical protein [Aggregatibacter kilianii]|uniref:hypothetical protein n=1 Tax=Aggregatibacter kilianii TaxID=2025884 RepID=UPI0028E772F8|nr:hypothetical protein [Aggregatibacter kilianii]